MKFRKFVTVAAIFAASLASISADAGSIGRSGGGGFSRSSSVSVSRPSVAPSKPAVAPAPSKPGGIGGNTASVGVRKTEVTNGVKQDIAATKPAPSSGSIGSTSSGSAAPHYTPTPSYGYAPAPQPTVVNGGGLGGGFGSSFLGSMTGTVVGNALFGHHGSSGGGTTVINNGTPTTSGSVSAPTVVADSNGVVSSSSPVIQSQPKKEYSVWSFIADVIGFTIVVALLVSVAWVFYKGFKLVQSYVNKERGVSDLPFSPTQRFWEIQKAFAAADVTALQGLLGPDVVDELTNGLEPSTLTLKNVSHEVRLQTTRELSVWYKFEDEGEEVNQVWHFERWEKVWKLNGIENV